MTVNSQSAGNSSGAGSSSGEGGSGQGAGAGTGEGQGQQQQGQQQQQQSSQSAVDLKTLEGDQLAQVLENPNLWQQPRIQELVKAGQDLKKIQADQKTAEEKRLEEQNEHKTLAEQRKAELEQSQTAIQNMKIDQALTNKLVPEGVIDLEAALKLVDRSKVKVDESGNITGVDDVLSELKKDKSYLFKEGGTQSLGSASNNNGGQGGQQTKFKRSQLRDPKFYQENRDAILAASKAGLIEDDLS